MGVAIRMPTKLRLPPTVIVGPVWRRHPVAAIVVATGVLTFLLTRGAGRKFDDQSRYHDQVFNVVQVLNGRSVAIDAPDGKTARTMVRLWGVDAAEASSADETTTFVRQQLFGKPVRVVLCRERTRDADGHLMAYLVVEATGECVNETILEAGLALADSEFDHPHQTDYARMAREARRNPRGM